MSSRPDRIDVYVPAAAAEITLGIARGSAIVGTPLSSGRVLIDYEGGIYGQAGFEKYETRLLHAADRHRTKYPSVARMAVDATELVKVGSYDPDLGLMVVADTAALADWLADA